jgi:DNA repair exonuclease SbcCD ATPase subunit
MSLQTTIIGFILIFILNGLMLIYITSENTKSSESINSEIMILKKELHKEEEEHTNFENKIKETKTSFLKNIEEKKTNFINELKEHLKETKKTIEGVNQEAIFKKELEELENILKKKEEELKKSMEEQKEEKEKLLNLEKNIKKEEESFKNKNSLKLNKINKELEELKKTKGIKEKNILKIQSFIIEYNQKKPLKKVNTQIKDFYPIINIYQKKPKLKYCLIDIQEQTKKIFNECEYTKKNGALFYKFSKKYSLPFHASFLVFMEFVLCQVPFSFQRYGFIFF